MHGTTLSRKTILRQSYDMTQDHLHAHDIFTYKIKYAKVCTGIFGAKVLSESYEATHWERGQRPMCGFIAQLVEHRTGIAEVTSSNPVEALIFSGFFFPIS